MTNPTPYTRLDAAVKALDATVQHGAPGESGPAIIRHSNVIRLNDADPIAELLAAAREVLTHAPREFAAVRALCELACENPDKTPMLRWNVPKQQWELWMVIAYAPKLASNNFNPTPEIASKLRESAPTAIELCAKLNLEVPND